MADDTNFKQLVELMAENNRATGEIERDGRNTRRHLLEMKKMLRYNKNKITKIIYSKKMNLYKMITEIRKLNF